MDTYMPFRVGKWLPQDRRIINNWLQDLIVEVEHTPKHIHPIIQELQNMIETDAKLFMLFQLMFEQVPIKYKTNPAGGKQIRDYKHALSLLNYIMTKAPEFNLTGLVGFPINAIFDWSMGTTAGFAAFLDDKFNRQLQKVLDEWAKFLESKDSAYVLNDNPRSGWFGEDAQKAMPNFVEEFKCDPEKPHYGFTSWDDFFTREFREGVRPIAEPENDNVIVNACESAPYRVVGKISLRNKFWIKGQEYSLQHLLNDDPYTETFLKGTIYQAFLSALSYHRWHSPVSGTIKKAYKIEGTYYSETLAEGFDPSGPNKSQGYIAEVATRALIFIEADNPEIGLMCFIPIGMAEVSTCDITVYEGQHVKKGDQLGMFHFGGSTHCLLFQSRVKLKFDFHGQEPGLGSKNIPINSRIATVVE
ncbi:MAG: phosphatidylserine decarboxylase family protein [Flavobacteriaceae bacterium]|nr:phosphatidylserine decarboxylase family protein [Flavobacteriaceae bacterium]